MVRFLAFSAVALSAAVTHADTGSSVAAHALVVGSNAGGPGQGELRYAEDDARRVGALLTELGGYAPASVEVVTHPTPASLRGSLDRLSQRVAADTAAGKQTRVFFYYSGHARATAIDLGHEPLPLEELRKRLLAAGATLTVVVLDACQSGAFSRVKGAQPTADFSFNSRAQLDAKGVAVLASSTGSELSQESEQLRSSYFTHHLLVGMRGAGDANGDGQVTVDEAYRYAYHQTLVATSATAVGGQHVTLEVDLKGHGEVALSYPRAATAAIELPGHLEGKTLVRLKKAGSVVAETHKAKGKPVRIAVAPGDYEVLVRQGDRVLRCSVTAPGTIELGRCANEKFVDGTRKGSVWAPEWYAVELGAMLGANTNDAFESRLGDFGYINDGGRRSLSIAAKAYRQYGRLALGGVLQVDHLTTATWQRSTELAPLTFDSSATMVGVGATTNVRLFRNFSFVADVAISGGMGRTRFSDQDAVTTTETFYGWGASSTFGLQTAGIFGTRASLGIACKVQLAMVIENDIGDSLNSGGFLCGATLGYQIGAR